LISSEEALLILSKWADEETLLLSMAFLKGMSFSLTGKISLTAPQEFSIGSRAGEAKLVFRLDDPELSFGYAERRDGEPQADLSEEDATLSGLTITFPCRVSIAPPLPDKPPKRERLIISEWRP
jgi:hypothetical protein